MNVLLRKKSVFSSIAIFLWLAVLLPALNVQAETASLATQQITDLDQLLKVVKENQRRERAKNRAREAEFLQAKNRQQTLLERARRDFDIAQKHNNPLKQITEANTAEIASLKRQLDEITQEMGDIDGIFNQMAGDFAAALGQSMISVQFPEREQTLATLLARDKRVTIADLETLWLAVQEEMTEQGKIAHFQAPVVTMSGNIRQQPVMRVGSFSAFSDGGFLRYVPETGEYLQLRRQPSARLVRAASRFAESEGEILPMVVDPTGGSLLGVMAYVPSLKERIEQGGVIGLIIIGLGLLGLLLTLWRVGYLGAVYLAIRRQLKQIETPRSNNPLGRVLLSSSHVLSATDKDENSADEGEIVQHKLDEAILAELPALERGHNLIKLLAATSPLLGLLGTVTGMILTFQAISLFGSGDPKLMAGGISQALVTTVLGLVAAIPLLFGYSLVSALSGSMIQRLDEQSAGIMARLAEQRLERGE